MNIFHREMKAHLKSLILWSVGMLLMITSGMAKFTSYSASGQSMNELLSQIPKSIRAILGMGNFDLTKASGFYGMLYLYLQVMAAIHASMLGANIIAKEERDKTAEFLMVKPVSRAGIVTAKLLAALANVIILNIVTLALSVYIVGNYSKGQSITGEILTLMAGMFFLQLIFLFTGTGIAAASRNPHVPASAATVVLLAAFILSAAIDLSSKLAPLRYITPFKYFEAENLLNRGGLNPAFMALALAITAILAVVTYVFYKRRDLHL